MAKEETFPFEHLWFRSTQMKNCFRCHIEFKMGDLITRITVRLRRSQRTRNYHKACWDRVLQ